MEEDISTKYRKEGYQEGFKEGVAFATKHIIGCCNSFKTDITDLAVLIEGYKE